MSAEEKKKIFDKSKGKIAVLCGGLGVAFVVYYVSHLQETPITHRKRYIAFTPSQFQKISQFERDMVSMLSVTHTYFVVLSRCYHAYDVAV